MSFFKIDEIFFYIFFFISIIIVAPYPVVLKETYDDYYLKIAFTPVVRIIADKNFKDQLNNIWTCGGTIVAADLVITSAACAIQPEIEPKYVAFGTQDFKNYSRSDCVVKVINTVTHPSFKQDNKKWKLYDIAILKTEKKIVPLTGCEVQANISYINLEQSLEAPGITAFALGWGVAKFTETPSTSNTLNYAAVKIATIDSCLGFHPLTWLIPSTICSISQAGSSLVGQAFYKGFTKKCENLVRNDGKVKPECMEIQNERPEHQSPVTATNDTENADKDAAQFDADIADMLGLLRQKIKTKRHRVTSATKSKTKPKNDTKRKPVVDRQGSMLPPLQPGNCLNDHGGPLYTWQAMTLVLIGVSTAYRVRKNTMECVGPFWYTSTAKNAEFIYCTAKKMGSELLTLSSAKRSSRDEHLSCG